MIHPFYCSGVAKRQDNTPNPRSPRLRFPFVISRVSFASFHSVLARVGPVLLYITITYIDAFHFPSLLYSLVGALLDKVRSQDAVRC